jgi:hypothetical protein
MGNRRDAYTFMVERLEGKRQLGRPRVRWNDNITKLLKKWNEEARTACIRLRKGTGGGLL